MAITFTCQCGQRFSAPDEAQGKATKCPKCGASLTVPRAEPARPQASPPPSGPPPLHDVAGVAASAPFMPAPAGPAAGPLTPSPLRPRPDRRAWIIAGTGLAICYWALIVGGIGFGIIGLMVVVGVADPATLTNVFGGPGTARFAVMILLWSVVAWLASLVVLVTGWFVCCRIPERARARQLVQGSVACAGIVVGLLILMQLVSLVMMPPMPDPRVTFGGPGVTAFDVRRPGVSGGVQGDPGERTQAMNKWASATQNVAQINKTLSWLGSMAWLGGIALFGLFVGAAGEHLGHSVLRQWSYGVAAVQGVIALCMTLFFFVLGADTPATIVRSLLILSTLLQVATYGALIYMVYQTRRVVPAD
jgi:hypothetical protein